MNHAASKNLNLTLKIWRQAGPKQPGGLKTYQVRGISTDMSFLEMLDVLNEQLIASGEEPVAFDHDCREGIARHSIVSSRLVVLFQ